MMCRDCGETDVSVLDVGYGRVIVSCPCCNETWLASSRFCV